MSIKDEIQERITKYEKLYRKNISEPPEIESLHDLIFEVILLYNSNILSGYYVSDDENHKNILDLLISFESSFFENDPTIVTNISKLIVWAEGCYLELINKKQRIKFAGKLGILVTPEFWRTFESRELKPGDGGINSTEAIFTYISLLKINIEVAYLDLFLSSSVENLQKLLSFYDQLETFKTTLQEEVEISKGTERATIHQKAIFFCKILQDKISFLADKINDVFHEEGLNYFFYQEFGMLNYVNIKYLFNETKQLKEQSEVFLTDGDLSLKSSDGQLFEIIRDFLKGEELSLIKYRLLTRLINCNPSTEINHNQLIDRFERQFNPVATDKMGYTQYIINLMHLFLYNNKLSYQLNTNESLEKVRETYEQITVLCTKYSINNHFPHQKIAKKYIHDLNKVLEFHTISEKDRVLKVDSLMTDFRKILSRFDVALTWSINNKFVPFFAEQNDCTITISNEKGEQELFIASAFSTPLHFSKIEVNLTGLKSLPVVLEQQVNNLHGSLAMLKSITTTKKEIEALKSGMVNNEKKQIQILGIFSAIVLFVAGNIQIFTKVTSLATGLHFMFIFALCLSLFVLLIWVISKSSDEKFNHWQWVFMILYLALMSFAVYSFSFDHDRVKPDTDKSDIQIFKIE